MEKIPTRQPRIDQGHISPQRLHFLIYIDLWFWGKMWPGHVLSNWVNPVNNRFKSNEVTVVSRNRHRNWRERQEEMQRWVTNRSRIWQEKRRGSRKPQSAWTCRDEERDWKHEKCFGAGSRDPACFSRRFVTRRTKAEQEGLRSDLEEGFCWTPILQSLRQALFWAG